MDMEKFILGFNNGDTKKYLELSGDTLKSFINYKDLYRDYEMWLEDYLSETVGFIELRNIENSLVNNLYAGLFDYIKLTVVDILVANSHNDLKWQRIFKSDSGDNNIKDYIEDNTEMYCNCLDSHLTSDSNNLKYLYETILDGSLYIYKDYIKPTENDDFEPYTIYENDLFEAVLEDIIKELI
jgi:hypothetical protein